MAVDELHTPHRHARSFFPDALVKASARISEAMAQAVHDAVHPTPEAEAHRKAEADLLAAAVAFTKTQAALAANTGSVPDRSAAVSAHAQLHATAKAYGAAHAALVAAS